MMTMLPVLLASASPRRRQILAELGIPYEVCVSPIDEEALLALYDGPTTGIARWLAEEKARAALTLAEAAGRIVVTADTTVLLDGKELGKPRGPGHARALLLSLRDRWHRVVTGVAVSTSCTDAPL
jgi:septum formation protein